MRLFFALFLTVFGWGSAFIFIRLGLDSYSPSVVAFGRYGLAALVGAVVYLFTQNKSVISISDRLKAMACGMVGMGIYSFTIIHGEVTVSASITSFIINLMPLLSALAATVFYKEPLTKRLLMGFGISLLGLSIIAFSETDVVSFGRGLIWLFVGLLAATSYTLMQKPVIKKMRPTEFICHALWGAALLLGVLLLIDSPDVVTQVKDASATASFAIVFLALVPSILAFFGWSYALTQTTVAKAGLFLYTIPLVTAVMALFILKEKPGLMLLSGMLLAASGSVVGTIKLPQREKELNATT